MKLDDDYSNDDPPVAAWVVWAWIVCTAVIGAGYIWGMVKLIEAMA